VPSERLAEGLPHSNYLIRLTRCRIKSRAAW